MQWIYTADYADYTIFEQPFALSIYMITGKKLQVNKVISILTLDAIISCLIFLQVYFGDIF